MPRVSVVLPVHNGGEYLQEAVDSILTQTYTDYELVIVDDASTDDAVARLDLRGDNRVRIVTHADNRGLPATLNHAVDVSAGEFIARQDQDDISSSQRLERQVQLLDADPSIGLVGTWASILGLDESGKWTTIGAHRHPASDPVLRWRLLWNSPFVHSSVVMRRTAFDLAGGYATEGPGALPEDYDLWSRMALVTRLANVPEMLHAYRETPGGLSRAQYERVLRGVLRISAGNFERLLGLPSDNPDALALAEGLNGLRPHLDPVAHLPRRLQSLNRARAAIDGFAGRVATREFTHAAARFTANSISKRGDTQSRR